MNTVLRAILRGTVYRLLPRGKMTLVVLGLVALVMLVMANGAKSATYQTTCTVDPPLCERIEAVVAAIEALPQTDVENDYATVLAAIEANTAGSGGPVEGTVALAEPDRAALLDTRRATAWAVGLLVFGLVILPLFSRIFNRGTGNV